MSAGGTFLVVITATLFTPLLSTNQSLKLPEAAFNDRFSNISPFAETDVDSDGVANLFLTLRLPQPIGNKMDSDLDMKRQFDPWGGKRRSKSLTTDEDISRKRQFSPWGGKRSTTTSFELTDDDTIGEDLQEKEMALGNKRNFNSFGGKRGFNSWGGKRGFSSSGGKKNFDVRGSKRSFNSWGGKRNFNSWGGKRNFNSWGGKRNFNAWGGKRSGSHSNEYSAILPFISEKNTNAGDKRQAFNSWGGKRSFNSWGGKRTIEISSGKRPTDDEIEAKELNNIADNSVPTVYDVVVEETEKNMR